MVAPSWAGAALAVVAMVAFLARTPVKLVLVDRRRHRWLPRTRLAVRIAAIELVVLTALAAVASTLSGLAWLVPVGLAAPLVAVELWFESRSRGRRLVPELCGAAGIGAFAPAIALAGGALREGEPRVQISQHRPLPGAELLHEVRAGVSTGRWAGPVEPVEHRRFKRPHLPGR